MSEIDPNRRIVLVSGAGLPSAAVRRQMIQSMLAPLVIAAGNQPARRPEHPAPKKPQTEIEVWNAAVDARKREKKEKKA